MYSLSQVLCRAAQVNRHGIATQFQGHKRSWADTLDRVRSIAGALASLGVSNKDTVGILSANSDVCYQCLFAIPWAGGVGVPINTRWAPAEIVYCLNDSACSLLLVDEEFLDLVPDIRSQLDTVEHIVSLGRSGPTLDVLSLDDLRVASKPIDDQGRCGTDIAYLYFTSGTTGRSKGAVITHEHLIMNTIQWAQATGSGQNDVFLIIAPLFHLAGVMNAVAAAVFACGACFVKQFTPAGVVQEINACGVTNAALVVVVVDAIVKHLEDTGTGLPGLKIITYGGSPMPQATLRRAMKALPHVEFNQVYGQTEGGPTIAILPPQYHVLEGELAGKLASAGKPMPGTHVVIMDENDVQLATGEAGEICLRGLTISPGYWKLPELTAQTQRGGWLHTGDAGYLDADGFLYIVDRVKDLIITGGENVYPAEVEKVLRMHPAVLECAVIGIPSERWVEAVHAIVRLRKGESAKAGELTAFCRQQLAGFKCPRSIDFTEEPLPLNGAGKVLKRILRAPYWHDRERAI